MQPIAVVFCVLTLLTTALASRCDRATRWVALELLTGWIVVTICNYVHNVVLAVALGPALDLLAGGFVTWIWFYYSASYRSWLLLIVLTYVSQEAAHVAYAVGPPTVHRRYVLNVTLNSLYAGQLLLTVTGPRCGAWVSELRRLVGSLHDRLLPHPGVCRRYRRRARAGASSTARDRAAEREARLRAVVGVVARPRSS